MLVHINRFFQLIVDALHMPLGSLMDTSRVFLFEIFVQSQPLKHRRRAYPYGLTCLTQGCALSYAHAQPFSRLNVVAARSSNFGHDAPISRPRDVAIDHWWTSITTVTQRVPSHHGRDLGLRTWRRLGAGERVIPSPGISLRWVNQMRMMIARQRGQYRPCPPMVPRVRLGWRFQHPQHSIRTESSISPGDSLKQALCQEL